MTLNLHDFKSLTMPLLLGAVLMIIAGLAYFDLTPKAYRATAVVKVLKIGVNSQNIQSSSENPDDPGLAAIDAPLLQSNVITEQVIKNLQLSKLWSKGISSNLILSDRQILAQLAQETKITSRPRSSIIDITVTSPDRFEAAIIANEFAKVYKAYRDSKSHMTIDAALNTVRKQWDEQNKKFELAQAKLDSFSQVSALSNGYDDVLYNDSPRYEVLKKKQKELQDEISQQQSQLNIFKRLDKAEMRLLLHTSDPDTNSVLNSTYAKWREAEKLLAQTRIEHEDDSAEVHRAKLLSDNLDAQLRRLTDGILLLKQTGLSSLQAGLNQINSELTTAKPRDVPATNTRQGQAYRDAEAQLREATIQRDLLQKEMNDKAALAILQVIVMPQIIELAEPPHAPAIPDKKTAGLIVTTGVVLMFLGLIAFLLGNRTRAGN